MSFWDRVSLFSSGYLGTHYVDQSCFTLAEICLPCLPKTGIKGMHHSSQPKFIFYFFLTIYLMIFFPFPQLLPNPPQIPNHPIPCCLFFSQKTIKKSKQTRKTSSKTKTLNFWDKFYLYMLYNLSYMFPDSIC